MKVMILVLVLAAGDSLYIPDSCVQLAARYSIPSVLSQVKAKIAYAKLRYLHWRNPNDEEITRCYEVIRGYEQQMRSRK